MSSQIVVNLELGHIAKTLDMPTLSGHTHEWMVFVKGADGMNIQYFVEKVVFWLHDSYEPSKYAVKIPPYQVKQSGYAGFNLPIDIHFKNKSEPKYVRFHYDLFLHKENMPPVNHTRVEMLTFTNPADEFKKRLIKGGGIVKTQDSQGKEKKSHKESRISEDRHSRISGKERSDSEKSRHKGLHSDLKSSKSTGKSGDRRRGSVGDNDQLKKKPDIKENIKSTSQLPHQINEIKPKDKIAKVKIKIENPSPMSGLFSREESIDIKQIKKKETSKESVRKEKEKRLEVKVKKEMSSKLEHNERQRNRKESPAIKKPKLVKDVKHKRPRTMSSSSSSSEDISRRRKSSLISSHSDSESGTEIKKTKKHSKLEKEKIKKSTKKPQEINLERSSKKSLKRKHIERAAFSDKDHRGTPSPIEQQSKQPNRIHKGPDGGHVKKKRLPSPEKRRAAEDNIKIHSKDIQRSETPKPKDKSHSYRSSSTPKLESQPPRREKHKAPTPAPVPLPTKKIEKNQIHSSSENSSSSSEAEIEIPEEKEVPHQAASPASLTSSSSSSPTQDFSMIDPQTEHDESLNASNDEPASPDHSLEASDVDDSFERDNPTSQPEDIGGNSSDDKVFSPDENETHPYPTPKSCAVMIGMGDEAKYYPHMTNEIFEQLQRLQNILATVTDENRLRKISSIVQKTGKFSTNGNMMSFDLCSMDKNTIHKIKKYLSASKST